jgi:uncharacterized protein (TIGR00255 family)
MSLKSMTGFGRAAGQEGGAAWVWEVRTVNNRGLDVRLRLPQGYEEIEPRLREAIAKVITRGSCAANLSLKAPPAAADLRLNEPVLLRLAELAERARTLIRREQPVALEALLAMRGVIETAEPEPDAERTSPLTAALLGSFDQALNEVLAARQSEGARIRSILSDKIAEIEALTRDAETSPERQPEAIAARLRQQLARLLSESTVLDENRLHQEAVLIATKADIEEELKRLHAHVAAAQDLIEDDAPVGRKLEFLAQEFQREANTLCSKSNATEITRIGLRLKTAIDQFREQVQNVE